MDNADYTEKCSGVDSAPLNAANPTSRVHAVLGSALLNVFAANIQKALKIVHTIHGSESFLTERPAA